MSKSLNITITPAGTVTVDAQGFQGAGCKSATEQIELVLGGGGETKKKPEYHSPPLNTSQGNKLTF